MTFEASQITFTNDGFSPRLELRAGDIVIGRTLTQEDMASLADAFAKHSAACAAVAESFESDDLDVPRWKRRMAARAAKKGQPARRRADRR